MIIDRIVLAVAGLAWLGFAFGDFVALYGLSVAAVIGSSLLRSSHTRFSPVSVVADHSARPRPSNLLPVRGRFGRSLRLHDRVKHTRSFEADAL